MQRRITILGSTGSIGRSALSVVRHHPDRFKVVGLAARSDADTLADQAAEFHPEFVGLADEKRGKVLRGKVGNATLVAEPGAAAQLAAQPVDVVLCAMVGARGLDAVLSAIDAGNNVALANKEPMVIAGTLIMERAREKGVQVLPVDSEHSAIFQCIEGHAVGDIYKVHITASGGPFYGRTLDSLHDVTPEQATKHPTWDMGAKISVDSATLMNKGLEVIEAMRLFNLPLDKISVVIHPQSIVHSLVEFSDGGILAHLGPTDMRIPIQFALTWPERVESPVQRLNLTTMGSLTFDRPNFSEFPCLRLALEAAARGGTAPALLNAANETAVEAFARGRIAFSHIPNVIDEVMSSTHVSNEYHLNAVLAADAEGRVAASAAVQAAKAHYA